MLVFDALRKLPGVHIVRGAVTTRRRDDKLALEMARFGVPSLPLSRLADPEFARVVRHDHIDLIVLANVTTKLARENKLAAHKGAVCFHPSYLPEYRGADACEHQAEAGETASGVSIFVPGVGMDKGPIVRQMRVYVPGGISASDLYHNHLVLPGVAVMAEAVKAIRDGTATYTPQPVETLVGALADGNTRVEK